MTFKCKENPFLYVEGLQFLDGTYSTDKESEIAILKRYKDSISVVQEEEKESEKSTENAEGINGTEKVGDVDKAEKTAKTKK